MAGGKPRMTPTLIPSLTLLAADIGLADACEAEGWQEAHALIDLAKGHCGDLAGPLSALCQQAVQLGRVRHKFVGAVPQRRNELHHDLREVRLQVAVHLALVLGLQLSYGLPRQRGVDREE